MTYIDGFFQEKEGNYGRFMKCALKYETLKPGEDGYVRFDIMPKKDPSKNSTHYGKLSEWTPQKKEEPLKTGSYGKQPETDPFDMDSIPFNKFLKMN